MQLLQKLSITAVGKREKLLRVIQNPVTKYLPINSRKIGNKLGILFVLIHPSTDETSWNMFNLFHFFFVTPGFSHSSDKLVNMQDYVAAVSKDVDLVFVVRLWPYTSHNIFHSFWCLCYSYRELLQVGAMAHGKIEPDYVDEYLSGNLYPETSLLCSILDLANAFLLFPKMLDSPTNVSR